MPAKELEILTDQGTDLHVSMNANIAEERMSAVRLQSITPRRFLMVRRVLRMGADYICGICRKKHEEAESANRCLDKCWITVQCTSPFIPVRRLNRLEYACIYCLRSYSATDDATRCAMECSGRMEITGYDGSVRGLKRNRPGWRYGAIAPVPVKKLEAVVAVSAPLPPALEMEKPQAPIAAIEPEPVQPPTVEVAPTPNPGKDKPILRKPADRTKKFERAGAKYVCIVCHEKYFTKMEVENCFEAHPD